MIDFLTVYSEAGMIGVVGAMFVYLVISLSQKSAKQQESLEDLRIENKGQSETLENMEGMIIKLIDRWNKSDETRDRRHEDMVKEVNDLSDVMMEVKGSVSRINGRK
jgi:predicted  nucleic acid-binding Zn-ribbon protein